MKKQFLFLLTAALLIFISCSDKPSKKNNRVIIGISEDVDSFNPLYALKEIEGAITEMLNLSLVKHKWDKQNDDIISKPMLAESWDWNNDSSSVLIKLRENIFWSDSVKITTADVVFSFLVYSNPEAKSKFFGFFENFYLDENGQIDASKSFNVISDQELKINFKPGSIPSLYDIDYPIIPKHKFENVEVKDYATTDFNFNPVTSGPYKIKKWLKNQSIILGLNKNSFLYNPTSIKEIIFKILPDYNSQLNQIKTGEIDLMLNLQPEDAAQLKGNENLIISTIDGREYDYIGWNNIDPEKFASGKIAPHNLFGDSKVRKALSMAVNRQEILEEFLMGYGILANSPVTPIFKNSLNKNLEPYKYNPETARKLLSEAGWKDNDRNGILEKNGFEFKFELTIPSGNPRRDYAAAVIKNNLKAVGIDVKISSIELGLFIDNLYERKMDAWMAAWYVPIPIDLKVYWYSDFEAAPLNFQGYKNKEIDRILLQLETIKSGNEKNQLLKKFQTIIHTDEPATFLYWINSITAYNKKIKNIDVNPLGAIQDCWEWSIAQ